MCSALNAGRTFFFAGVAIQTPFLWRNESRKTYSSSLRFLKDGITSRRRTVCVRRSPVTIVDPISMLKLTTIHRVSKARGFSGLLRGIVTTVIVLTAIVLSADGVFASTCGHYLYRNGKPVSQHNGPMGVVEFGVDVAEEHVQPVRPDAPAPCKGPGCKGQSIPLVPASAPFTISRTLDPAALLDDLLSRDGSQKSFLRPHSERGEFYQAARLFRPPCA
jgi:hypothetical protein